MQPFHVKAHRFTVCKNGSRKISQRAAKLVTGAFVAPVVSHCSPEQRAVSPLRQNTRQRVDSSRVKGGRRLQALQNIADQGGVAINVSTDLQERRSAVATGERDDVRFRQDGRHDHRPPGQTFKAQHQAHFFCKWRRRKMMQDQLSHGLTSVGPRRGSIKYATGCFMPLPVLRANDLTTARNIESCTSAQGRAKDLSVAPGNIALFGKTVTTFPPCHCDAVNDARTFCKLLSNLAPKPDG